jgi:hypothetical protein
VFNEGFSLTIKLAGEAKRPSLALDITPLISGQIECNGMFRNREDI